MTGNRHPMLVPAECSVVLVRPARESNMGAVARGMKTMGFTRLVLVAPEVRPGNEAYAVAHGAHDVLDGASIVDTLGEGVGEADLVFGTTARRGRDRATPVALRHFVQEVLPGYLPARVAMVFGPEATGLTIEDLEHCQFGVEIPSGPLFHSLNLSHAVMVVCYEVHASLCHARATPEVGLDPGLPATPRDETRRRRMHGLYRVIEGFLKDVGYPTGSSVTRAMADLRRVLDATYMTERDTQTAMGLFRHLKHLLKVRRDGNSMEE